ncbi:GerAB/ArcD/ProY family transporter [Niallia sp. NCCP-28]|uniref:GerAB/ArcD/ProY family transporter n=1 Tax=Niallia sp. NCCP-28 TaxID=2934712 RepID=UPI002087952D|nr:GerAB/ArcD/ProY family transporter [Niallia sp. NCCP-28]GKU83519.1 spore germination protein KB [Niallia sp. NCCP-28]
MEKAKISVIQLFAMMFIFEMGTALVISYGITARKDAWIASLLSMGGGIILFFIYYSLFRQYPKLPLTGYIREIFGKYLGWMIGFIYIIYFLYIAARNLRELGDLLVSSTLKETPLMAIIIPLVLAICYVIYMGAEVLARTSEVFIVILFLFGIVGNFLALVSGNVEFHNLLPILEHGWKPILTTAFPEIIAFPFAEVIVFTMLLPLLNKPKYAKRVWLSSLLSSGIILSWTVSLNIAVLGVQVTERATFPTLSTVSKINLMDFIQRLDAIIVFTLLITVFFKASIYLYAAAIGIADLFKLDSHHRIVLPIGTVVIYLSLNTASNFSEHLEEGKQLSYYLHVPMLMVIPLLLLIISFIKKTFKKKTISISGHTD